MDDYIKGLKLEAEQVIFDIEEMKQQHRKQLSAYDHEILNLMNQKMEEKSKLDAKLAEVKAEAEGKIEMYNKFAGVRTGPHLSLMPLLSIR
jgi:hypothetical protein